MSDLRELYQETIIGHAKKPKNFGKPEKFNRKVEGYNPLCGDRLTLYMNVENGKVEQACFEGSGCAISTASASLMTEAVKGRDLDDAEELADAFHEMITNADALPDTEKLGKLAVFTGVHEFPSRVKCATLCWHSLKSALHEDAGTVSTE